MANSLGNPGLVGSVLEFISRVGGLNVAMKQALVKMVRANPEVFTQSADTADLDSTTYSSSTELVKNVRAGQAYRVYGFGHVANATAADGCKTRLFLSGTQTSAVVNGMVTGFQDNGAGADTTTTALATISSGVIGEVSDADSTAVGAEWDIVLVPQNDGTLSVQYAEVAAGAGAGARLKKGSFLEVRELPGG